VIGGITSRARQLVDYWLRRGLDRVADGETDHVNPGSTGLRDLVAQFHE
jgi:hypothetical protein